jgi:hypothetical protein
MWIVDSQRSFHDLRQRSYVEFPTTNATAPETRQRQHDVLLNPSEFAGVNETDILSEAGGGEAATERWRVAELFLSGVSRKQCRNEKLVFAAGEQRVKCYYLLSDAVSCLRYRYLCVVMVHERRRAL